MLVKQPTARPAANISVPPPEPGQTMMVYKAVRPEEGPEGVLEMAWAFFGITGPVEVLPDRYIIKDIDHPSRIFEYYLASGSFWYGDLDKLWNEAYMPEALPSPDAAKYIADSFLEQYGLMPREAYFSGVVSTETVIYYGANRTERITNCRDVIYNMMIGDLIVDGPGAEIKVSIGEEGQIIGLLWSWRKLEPYGTFPFVPYNKAEALLSWQLHDIKDFEIVSYSIVYYAPPPMAYYDFVWPAYRFNVTATIGDEEVNFVRYIPATTFNPVVKITSPEHRSEHEEGSSISFDCEVVGGTPPYTFEWYSDVDGFLASHASFMLDRLSVPKREGEVIPHEITVRVIDANGLVAEDTVLVFVLEAGAPAPPPPQQVEVVPTWAWAVIGGLAAIAAIEGVALVVRGRKGTSSTLAGLLLMLLLSTFILMPMALAPRARAENSGGAELAPVAVEDDDRRWEFCVEYVEGKEGIPNTDDRALGFCHKAKTWPGWHPGWPFGMPEAGVWGGVWAWEEDFKYETAPGGGKDYKWVDAVDLCYYTNHGNPNGFCFNSHHDDEFLHYSEARWGDQDLEWIVLDACRCLRLVHDGKSVWARWGPAFRGLHYIFGFDTVAHDSPSRGELFATYISLGFTIRQAWIKACQDTEPSSVWTAYLRAETPGPDSTIWEHAWGFGYVSPDPWPYDYLAYFHTSC